jgi:hypothetical protein
MAIHTIVAYGFVLKQEWPALFRMAGVTSLIHRRFFEKLLVCGAMWVVTARALEFSFTQRHVR